MAETSNSGTEAAGRTGPSPSGSKGERLTVLYDETCSFCRRCRDWLLGQRCFLEVELLAAGSPIARERYGSLPWLGRELVAVDQAGRLPHLFVGDGSVPPVGVPALSARAGPAGRAILQAGVEAAGSVERVAGARRSGVLMVRREPGVAG
jgi:hypothetical protein